MLERAHHDSSQTPYTIAQDEVHGALRGNVVRTHRHRHWLQVSAMDYGVMNINESMQDRGCLNAVVPPWIRRCHALSEKVYALAFYKQQILAL